MERRTHNDELYLQQFTSGDRQCKRERQCFDQRIEWAWRRIVAGIRTGCGIRGIEHKQPPTPGPSNNGHCYASVTDASAWCDATVPGDSFQYIESDSDVAGERQSR